MKIVIISDLHGNYEALKALPELGDELWVLDDLVNYGPEPSEVVEFVREKSKVVVRGNHDQSIGFNEDPRCTPLRDHGRHDAEIHSVSVERRSEGISQKFASEQGTQTREQAFLSLPRLAVRSFIL